MPQVRQPAVAGSFYPADPDRLRELVRGFLEAAAPAPPGEPPPKAVIVPHAGYRYSGPVAGSAYARLRPGRARISRVVLLGPAHRVAFRGLALPSADGFRTPLGSVPVDQEAIACLQDLAGVRIDDPAHAREHSLEVQLPFLQEILGPFNLVPVLAGEAGTALVEAVLDRLWGGAETAIVVSSDLSHYLEPAAARRLDQATSGAITGLRPEAIDPEGACGLVPVRGLLAAARRRGLRCSLLDLRSSGDTAPAAPGGGPDRVVGYGAYAFA